MAFSPLPRDYSDAIREINMWRAKYTREAVLAGVARTQESACEHGECFGGKCIYATDAVEGPATVWMERRLRNAALNADNPVNFLCSQAADTIESLRLQVAELGERLGDANTMLEKCNSQFIVELEAENAALRKELVEAWETAIDWAQYASPYFQEKWGLAEDIKKLERARGHAKNDAK